MSLVDFFFFFLATFPIYTCTQTKSEFPVLHRQSTETHTTVLGCDQSVCTEMGTCLHVSVPSSASSSHTGRSGAYSVAFHAASTGPTTARKSCFVGTCAANSTMTTLGKNLSEYSLGHKDGSQRKLSPTYGYEFWVTQTRDQALGKPEVPVCQWGRLPTFLQREKLREKWSGRAHSQTETCGGNDPGVWLPRSRGGNKRLKPPQSTSPPKKEQGLLAS